MDLNTTHEPSGDKYTIVDERIVKNGFNVVIVFDGMLHWLHGVWISI